MALLTTGALAVSLVAGFANPSAPAPTTISLSADHATPRRAPGDSLVPDRQVDCRRLKCIALTFDDGPGEYTERLLGVLRSLHAPATFFMVGLRVQQFPHVARDVALAGEEIGDHTWDHRDLTQITLQQARGEILQARAEIQRATGLTPRLLRPPYGSIDASVLGLAGSLGLAVQMWDVDTVDWLYRDPARVTSSALSAAGPGKVILMHDIYGSTVDAVPGIIKALRSQGYTLVTVSQLFGSMRAGKEYFGLHDTPGLGGTAEQRHRGLVSERRVITRD